MKIEEVKKYLETIWMSPDVNDIDDVPEHLLKEIAHFFSVLYF